MKIIAVVALVCFVAVVSAKRPKKLGLGEECKTVDLDGTIQIFGHCKKGGACVEAGQSEGLTYFKCQKANAKAKLGEICHRSNLVSGMLTMVPCQEGFVCDTRNAKPEHAGSNTKIAKCIVEKKATVGKEGDECQTRDMFNGSIDVLVECAEGLECQSAGHSEGMEFYKCREAKKIAELGEVCQRSNLMSGMHVLTPCADGLHCDTANEAPEERNSRTMLARCAKREPQPANRVIQKDAPAGTACMLTQSGSVEVYAHCAKGLECREAHEYEGAMHYECAAAKSSHGVEEGDICQTMNMDSGEYTMYPCAKGLECNGETNKCEKTVSSGAQEVNAAAGELCQRSKRGSIEIIATCAPGLSCDYSSMEGGHKYYKCAKAADDNKIKIVHGKEEYTYDESALDFGSSMMF